MQSSDLPSLPPPLYLPRVISAYLPSESFDFVLHWNPRVQGVYRLFYIRTSSAEYSATLSLWPTNLTWARDLNLSLRRNSARNPPERLLFLSRWDLTGLDQPLRYATMAHGLQARLLSIRISSGWASYLITDNVCYVQTFKHACSFAPFRESACISYADGQQSNIPTTRHGQGSLRRLDVLVFRYSNIRAAAQKAFSLLHHRKNQVFRTTGVS